MNEDEKQDTMQNNESNLADLEARNADEVKGGPIYMQYEGVKGHVTTVGYEKEIQ